MLPNPPYLNVTQFFEGQRFKCASQSGDKEAIMGTMVYLTADNQLLKSCFLSNSRLLSVKTNYKE
jgi:hypothetical protein